MAAAVNIMMGLHPHPSDIILPPGSILSQIVHLPWKQAFKMLALRGNISGSNHNGHLDYGIPFSPLRTLLILRMSLSLCVLLYTGLDFSLLLLSGFFSSIFHSLVTLSLGMVSLGLNLKTF